MYSNCTYIEKLEKENPEEWVIHISSEKKIIEIWCDRLECDLDFNNILFHKEFKKEFNLKLINFCCCKKHSLDSLTLALNKSDHEIYKHKLAKINKSCITHDCEENDNLHDQKCDVSKLISHYNLTKINYVEDLANANKSDLSKSNEDDIVEAINPKIEITRVYHNKDKCSDDICKNLSNDLSSYTEIFEKCEKLDGFKIKASLSTQTSSQEDEYPDDFDLFDDKQKIAINIIPIK